MDLREIRPGLRYWTAPHPQWNGATDWPEEVGCVYYEAPDSLVLVDPLLPRGEEKSFLPDGIETFTPAGVREGDVAFYIRPHCALVVAEFFMGVAGGLRVCPSPALEDRAAFQASLRTARLADRQYPRQPR